MKDEQPLELPPDVLPIRPNCEADGLRLRDQDSAYESLLEWGTK